MFSVLCCAAGVLAAVCLSLAEYDSGDSGVGWSFFVFCFLELGMLYELALHWNMIPLESCW